MQAWSQRVTTECQNRKYIIDGHFVFCSKRKPTPSSHAFHLIMSVFGAPGAGEGGGFGIHITPLVGATGQLEGIHVGPPAVGAMTFAELRAAAAESAAQKARELRASAVKNASAASHYAAKKASAAAHFAAEEASAAGHFAATKANAAADRAEVAACKRASDAGFEEVAAQRGYTKTS